MQLTITPYTAILKTGTAEYSPLAENIIRELQQVHRIHAAAIYLQDCTHIDISETTSADKLLKQKKPIRFVNEIILTFYIHKRKSCVPADTGTLKALLHDVFQKHLQQSGITPDFERLYTPEEMRFYGWNQTKKEAWDTSKVIPTEPLQEPPTAQHCHACSSNTCAVF